MPDGVIILVPLLLIGVGRFEQVTWNDVKLPAPQLDNYLVKETDSFKPWTGCAKYFTSVSLLLLLLTWLGLPVSVCGDVLVLTNGERFVGEIIEEKPANVIFESELAGRLDVPRSKIRDVGQAQVELSTNTVSAHNVGTNASSVGRTASWTPPGVGTDGADWVELKSGEWLRGELKYVQDKDVEFDSDEMEMQTLKLKDVRRLYTAHGVFTQFENQKPSYGTVVISNNVVVVNGDQPMVFGRDLLIGITPSGIKTGIRNWSGNATLGLSLQSGNNHQYSLTTSAELARRTPNTTLLLNYLGNYSEANGVQSANNQRFNCVYDIRLNRQWFVRPAQLEYYQDPLANIAHRLTGGVGAGYYIFDRTGLEWQVSAGPSLQYTRFSTVETGEDDANTTGAALLNSYFKADITSRLTFIQSWQSTFTKRDAGRYFHHTVTTLEFEIKKHLDLDVSYIWDYLQDPETKSDGQVPQKSDQYLTVGFGVRF